MVGFLYVCVCVFSEQAGCSSGLPAADPHPGLFEPQPEPGLDELALGETDSRSAVIIKTSLHPPAAPMLLAFLHHATLLCFALARHCALWLLAFMNCFADSTCMCWRQENLSQRNFMNTSLAALPPPGTMCLLIKPCS